MTSAVAPTCVTRAPRPLATSVRSSSGGDFESLKQERLQWLPELGLGFLDVETPGLYDEAYFELYRELEPTDLARHLNAARCEMVERYWRGEVTDVGIGCGTFIEAYGRPGHRAHGWDVNPSAIKWLMARGLLRDPRSFAVDAATLWDSIEHMRDPSEILDHVKRWAFISTPIYRDAQDARSSKHYKPGEHLWYFTDRGLRIFMERLGFTLRESNNMESALGRDCIGSYAFERAAS